MPKHCENHGDSPAVASCATCGRSVCLMCVEADAEVTYCSTACVAAGRERQRLETLSRPKPKKGMCAVCFDKPEIGHCQVCDQSVCEACVIRIDATLICSGKCQEVLKEVQGWMEKPAAAAPAPAPAAVAVEAPPAVVLVPCAHCGKTVDRQRAIESSWGLFCSTACAAPPEAMPALAEAETSEPAVSGSGVHPVVYALIAVGLVAAGIFALQISQGSQKPPADLAKVSPSPAPKPEPKPEPKAVPIPLPPPPLPKPEPKPEPKAVPVPVPPPVPPKPAPAPLPPKPKPEAAPLPPKPPLAAHLAKARDPWGAEKPGAWYRFKTSADGKDAYQDLGFKEAGEGYRLLLVQSKPREPEESEQHRWIEVREIAPRGEKKLDLGAGSLAVDLAAVSGPRGEFLLWVVRDGPHAGAVIHTESPGLKSSLRKVSSETLRIGARSFDCLVVEAEEGSGGRRVTRWFSTSCPAGPVKTVAGTITEVLVDAGTDWATRPPFPAFPEPAGTPQDPEPPPKPPPPPDPPKPKEDPAVKTKAMLTEAAALLKESMPSYQEIAAATNPAPTERALRAMWKSRALEVKAKLLRARELYVACRDTDPVVLDRRVGTIDGLVESLDETSKRLE